MMFFLFNLILLKIMRVNSQIKTEISPSLELKDNLVKEDRFYILSQKNCDRVCKILLIAGIVACVALMIFCILWLACPSVIGLVPLSFYATKGVIQLAIFSPIGAILCGMGLGYLHYLSQFRRGQA